MSPVRLVRRSACRPGFAITLGLALALPAAPAGGQAVPGPGDDTVAVPAGARLREVASPVGVVLAVVAEDADLPLLDRSGAWVRVALGERTGWVDLAADEAAGAPPDPPPAGVEGATLLAVREEPAGEIVRAARGWLGEPVHELGWGRFDILTDRADHPLVPLGERIAADLPALHARRYGLPGDDPGRSTSASPVLPPSLGTVILFARDTDYGGFLAAVAGEAAARELAGHAGGGVAALPLGSRTAHQAAGTLVHELAHLLNERAFGPNLPPWLDEGLAGDLELVAIGRRGELDEARWAAGRSGYRGWHEPSGPLIALDDLLDDDRRARLENLVELMTLERPALATSPRRAELYALTALWVRFLLADGARATAFHSLLTALAAAPEPPRDGGAELLAEALGVKLASLEGHFRVWLRSLPRRR
ncbi:MAG TPA: hypothetical protein VM617_07075 [Thermoanaerobaculia bacterium]|nr:hypothetical protein [Thermoanaerobaculia bacterium]